MSDGVRRFSLKRQLLVALLGSIAVTWIAIAVFSYFDARHEIDELLDAHLAQSAALLVAQVGHELEEIDDAKGPPMHKRGRRVAFQIWERGTALRLHSANAPATPLSAREEGFSDASIDGRQWRVFSGWDGERRYLVQVGELSQIRDEIAASVGKNILLPLLFALPALGLLVWFSVARGLKPLGELRRQVAERDAQNLGALETVDAPVEVMPLVASLNRLFGRVSAMMENERRFTADAAHELRTPLAALRTQAQVARAATSDAERNRTLDNVIAGCDRTTHLLQQLLTLARLEPEQLRGEKESCDLHALARTAIAELAPAALAKNVEIGLEEGLPVHIDGYAGLIAIMLRNLIDNAVRYSPGGRSVNVAVTAGERMATVCVTDQGPGIALEERNKVGQRFYRILGSEETGSGLGLSIVKRIAELHRATVTLGDGEGAAGLRVTVTFLS
jgi:two-component system sensor histidine kinase QseC